MTNAVQFSTKVGDDILVVGGANYAEFSENFISTLGQEAFDATIGSFTAKVAATQGQAGIQQAVHNVQQGGVATPNPGLQQQYAPPAQQNTPPAQGGQGPQEFCTHGAKKWVPPGTSKSTGKPYPGFYACPAPRGQQCR